MKPNFQRSLPSGNLIGDGATINNFDETREQIKKYYNALMNTSTEHLKSKNHRIVVNLDKEIRLCKIFLNETK
jgi:hypothetical protein